MTNDQIRRYLQQAEQGGYSQAQLENLARQRGMSENQISKLRRRIESLSLEKNEQSNLVESTNAFDLRDDISLNQEDVFGKLISSDDDNVLTETQRKIFGYSLFQTENLNFSPNLSIPTPQDYVLGLVMKFILIFGEPLKHHQH